MHWRDLAFLVLRICAVIACVAAWSQEASAQSCEGSWSSRFQTQSLSGTCYALLPLPGAESLDRVVIAGQMLISGNPSGTNITIADLKSGHRDSLLGGMNGRVSALIPDDGGIIAAGLFTSAGGVPVNNIAKWTGSTWIPLGSGLNGDVYAMARLANGDLVVGGTFTTAGGVPASKIARWDGQAWSAVNNFLNNDVTSLLVLSDGSLVVGGAFFQLSGGSLLSRVARWDGAKWTALGAGFNDRVNAIEELSSGDLVACGNFSMSGSTAINRVARWNGTAWVSMASGLESNTVPPKQVRLLPSGKLVLTAEVPVEAGRYLRLYQWNGTWWTPLTWNVEGSSTSSLQCVAEMPDGRIIFGGLMQDCVRVWTGTALQAPVTWFSGTVNAIAQVGRDIFYAGSISRLDSREAFNIVKERDGIWSTLPRGVAGAINVLHAASNGDLYAGGTFTLTTEDGKTSGSIALWRGDTWQALGTGIQGTVNAIVTLPNGDLVAGGLFSVAGSVAVTNVAIWDGANWKAIPGAAPAGPTPNLGIRAIEVAADGSLIVAGQFYTFGSVNSKNVVRWRNGVWSNMQLTMLDWVNKLLIGPNDTVIAVGRNWNVDFSGGTGAAFYQNGWAFLGNQIGSVFTGDANINGVARGTDGTLYIGGSFSLQNVSQANYARLIGRTWSHLANGPSGPANAVFRRSNGNILFGGGFTQTGSQRSVPIAEWVVPSSLAVYKQPIDATSCGGRAVEFDVDADGGGELSYRWQIEDPSVIPWGWRDIDDGEFGLDNGFRCMAANTKIASEPLRLSRVRGTVPQRLRFLIYNNCGALLSNTVTLQVHAADFNCDGFYDDRDFEIFSAAYDIMLCTDPTMPAECPSDLNADGVVDDADFSEFVVAYNAVLAL